MKKQYFQTPTIYAGNETIGTGRLVAIFYVPDAHFHAKIAILHAKISILHVPDAQQQRGP